MSEQLTLSRDAPFSHEAGRMKLGCASSGHGVGALKRRWLPVRTSRQPAKQPRSFWLHPAVVMDVHPTS